MTDAFDISRVMVQLFDQSAESILVADREGRVLYANQATATYSGTTIAEMRGQLLWEVFPALVGTTYDREFQRALHEQVPVTAENYYPPTDLWFEVRFYPSPEAVAIFGANITERKKASEAIRLSEEKHRRLLNTVNQGYCHCQMLWDAAGNPADYRFLEVNPVFEQMTGLANAEGKTAKEIIPGLEPFWFTRYGEVVRSGEAAHFEHGSDYMGRIFDIFATPMGNDNFVVLFTDVTARVRREAENAQLNVRLRRAMQETHHRVKNNLQVVAGLIELQTSDTLHEAAAVPLARVKQHVRTLAVIHDLLTRYTQDDPEVSQIGTKAILDTLLPMLDNTIGNRRIVADVADVMLSAQKAASLSLLVSECISNAVKHGRGDISVTLRREGKSARLEVCDDGEGFPPGFDPLLAANTGLQLIESAARWDLRGEVSYENFAAGGGGVVVTFPLETPAPT